MKTTIIMMTSTINYGEIPTTLDGAKKYGNYSRKSKAVQCVLSVEPVAQCVVEPVAQCVVEPVAQCVVEPVAQRVVEPVAQRVLSVDYGEIPTTLDGAKKYGNYLRKSKSV